MTGSRTYVSRQGSLLNFTPFHLSPLHYAGGEACVRGGPERYQGALPAPSSAWSSATACSSSTASIPADNPSGPAAAWWCTARLLAWVIPKCQQGAKRARCGRRAACAALAPTWTCPSPGEAAHTPMNRVTESIARELVAQSCLWPGCKCHPLAAKTAGDSKLAMYSPHDPDSALSAILLVQRSALLCNTQQLDISFSSSRRLQPRLQHQRRRPPRQTRASRGGPCTSWRPAQDC